MSLGMFGILALSGLCTSAFSPYLRQYYFINSARTWRGARQYCRHYYTDLATVNDAQDLKELAGLIGSGEQVAFVGLYKGWKWSLSDDDDYKEGEVAYRNWASNQPERYNCGSIGSTGKWFAGNCNHNLSFICYTASATNILQRFALVNGSSKPWLDAQAYCKKNYTDLARVRNQLENEELKRMVNNDTVWFGLRLMSWMWSDGSQPSFIPWNRLLQQKQNRSGDCGALDVSSSFHGLIKKDCRDKATFFCYSDPQRRHLVQLQLATKGSSEDARDPAVAASILNWVQKRLAEKGASTGVKLSWRKFSKKEKKQESAKELLLTKCVIDNPHV